MLNKIILILFLLLSFTPFASGEDSNDTISIGSILILTGEGSSWGTASRNGIDMAVEHINSRGGILGKSITVYHQDDQSDPKKALSAFRQLVNYQKVNIIIGPNWSNIGLAVQNLADKNEILMISPSLGVATFNESSKFLFNTKPHDYILSRSLADYVFDKGHRKIALVGAIDVWVEEQTKTFKEQFEKRGGEILLLEEPLPSSTDVKAIALKIKNKKNIDAFVSTTNGVILGSLVAKALKEMNVSLPMYSVVLDQSAIDASQGGFEELEFMTSLTPSAEFQKEYEERYTTHIDIGADGAYDAVMLIAKAIKETNSLDTKVLAEYLSGIKEYKGVSGTLISDGKGGFEKDSVIMKVTNGRPVRLDNLLTEDTILE
jgi:branched-chain amino acid transport system substrate-binding protein